jgi:hypothetical protein
MTGPITRIRRFIVNQARSRDTSNPKAMQQSPRRLSLVRSPNEVEAMIELTWLPRWKAYMVRINDRPIGLVRCRGVPPFHKRAAYV